MRGFSPQNIWRMKQFYETYKDSQILSTLLRELSWSNNLLVMSRAKTDKERLFYIRLSNSIVQQSVAQLSLFENLPCPTPMAGRSRWYHALIVP
jgi:predicted nuclease of restriction endonuclease-like (RecB) superfamily